MMGRLFLRRFVFQLILVFVVFTLATVIGLGIPITILLNRQVESQMRALLDQANQTSSALYENKINQLNFLAALIAERPTLNRLVSAPDDPIELAQYLDEFLANVNVDVILVCDQSEPLAMAGDAAVAALCSPPRFNAFTTVNDGVWLLVDAQMVTGSTSDVQVVVGQMAETLFGEFTRQTDLNYVLFGEQQILAASPIDLENPVLANLSPDATPYQKLALDAVNPRANTHMAGVIPLGEQEGFTLIGLLDITAYTALSRNVQNIILVTLLIVSLVGVFVAILVSRQISQPLNQLARSAVALREGDFSTALPAQSKVWEIDQLTNALEDARVSLKHSLNQLQHEKAWIENLLNSVIEGLLAIDERKRITYASEAIERIAGVRLALMLGRHLDEIFKTPSGENLFSHQLPAANQSRRIPVTVDGQEILLAVSASRLVPPDAGDATLALVVRDVTDEDRIHRLIGEFLANITHEFRTPLTALAASVELLLDQLPSLSTPEINQLLQVINIGIIDLQSLIDNLIEAASIEAGRFKVNPRPIPLQDVILDAILMVRPIAQRQGLKLVCPEIDPAITVYADQRRTCQALVNLLSNAINHSPEGGSVTITYEVSGDVAHIEVLDEGEGVPAEQRSTLFNRFVTPGAESEYGQVGLGLGLSVVKAIIEAQDGLVGYQARETGGANFWVTLPLVEGDSA